MALSERVIKILSDSDFSIVCEESSTDNRVDIDIEIFTPLGEDFIMTITYNGTDDDFIDEFSEYAEDFDADEHVAMWIEVRGKRGVPDSISDLIEDAEWIKSTLISVAVKLQTMGGD